MPITDTEILALEPKPKPYKVSIGRGAYILVMPNGQKYWRLKYHLNGKESSCALGVFPDVSIKAALVARNSARAFVLEGINPAVARREARRKAAFAEPLFLLALSKSGTLTIETDPHSLTLTVPQTRALRAFLTVNIENGKEM
jgi:Arm domain-containing DNA-binding protein